MFRLGAARRRLDVARPGVCMLGYADFSQKIEGARTDLHCRAFSIENGAADRLVYAVLDLAWVTHAVRQEVVRALELHHGHLGIGEHNLMLTATHTHSAPGGYSEHIIYNLSVSGFVPEVLAGIVEATVAAIVAAVENAAPGQLGWATGQVGADDVVARNRSLDAHNRNPDVVRQDDAAQAVDRTMTVLRFDREDGTPMAMLSWFGVHATSLPSSNRLVDADNKGYAARDFEDGLMDLNPDFVAGFAQTTPADVSPNAPSSSGPGARRTRADLADNARRHGQAQSAVAKRLFARAAAQPIQDDTLQSRIRYERHAEIGVDDKLTGIPGARTEAPRFGLSMAMGTTDGRGALFSFGGLIQALNKLADGRTGGGRYPLVHLGPGAHGEVFGGLPSGTGQIPNFLYPALSWIRKIRADGADLGRAWAPEVLPVQIARIGPLVVAALPGEPTTAAGHRIRHDLEKIFRADGAEQVVVAGYANAYASYIATPEEFDRQRYEGGSTLYGRHTLSAFRQRLVDLAYRLLATPVPAKTDIGVLPLRPSWPELDLQRHHGSAPVPAVLARSRRRLATNASAPPQQPTPTRPDLRPIDPASRPKGPVHAPRNRGRPAAIRLPRSAIMA